MFIPFKKDIKAFVALADFKSVSKAALSLGMTQPQLTKILRHIEDEAGATLFERTNRGLVITGEGLKLYKDLYNLQLFWSDMLPQSQGISSLFRIGAHALIAKEFVPAIVSDLHKYFPAVSLQYLEVSSKEVSHQILERSLEIGIAANPLPLQGLIIYEVKKHHVGLYSAGKIRDTLVVNPQLVQYSRLLKKVKHKKILEIENYQIAALTAKKIGCDVMLPSPAAEELSLQQMQFVERVNICLVYREGNRAHPMVKRMKEMLEIEKKKL
jgi:DNA-binding transcriptional LysR family regulator